MGKIETGLILLLVLGALLLAALLTILLVNIYKSKFKKEQSEKADAVILTAVEKAKTIELEARDKALKVLQESEQKRTGGGRIF